LSLAPSSSPTNVLSFVSSPRSASVSWFPPAVNGQNGIIVYYILVLTDVGFNSSDITINTTLTSYAFSNLEEYNVYSCAVAAATQVGLGPYSDPIQFTTQEDGECFKVLEGSHQLSKTRWCTDIPNESWKHF